MVKRIIRRSYSQIIMALDAREKLINQDFTAKVQLIPEGIEHLFYLDDLIGARLSVYCRKTQKPLEDRDALPLLLYKKNNHYLVAAYLFALKGLNNPSYSILRSVYEVILDMYTIHLTDREADLISKRETEQLTPEEHNELIKHHFFRHSEIIKILYQKDTQKKMREFYDIISKSSHPSIKGIMASFRYSKGATEDVLTLTLGLIFANFLAISEIYYDNLKEAERRKIDDILNKIGQELREVLYLIPDNPNFAARLKIKF